jgi:hypothetical protein
MRAQRSVRQAPPARNTIKTGVSGLTGVYGIAIKTGVYGIAIGTIYTDC